MGRQVNFYMTEEDEEGFIRFVTSERRVGIVACASPSREPRLLDVLPSRGVPSWFTVWLWDETTGQRPRLWYVPTQKHYVVDEYRSEVIQFWRCYVSGDGLIRGRIWAEMAYWDCGQGAPRLVTKSESFRAWFDQLAGWIRHMATVRQAGGYVLPGAHAYVRGGGRLCQAHFGPKVKVVRHQIARPIRFYEQMPE